MITIDEQIAFTNAGAGNIPLERCEEIANAILASLERLKRIDEAKVPEEPPYINQMRAVIGGVCSETLECRTKNLMLITAYIDTLRDLLKRESERAETLQRQLEELKSASQPDSVVVPVDRLENWAEYWNGSVNEKAMSDALEFILGEVADLLRAAKEPK